MSSTHPPSTPSSPLPKLILYRMNGACSLVPHILLHELAIPFSAVLMTIGPNGAHAVDGSLSPEEYIRTVHPNGMIPALQITSPTSNSSFSSSSSSNDRGETTTTTLTENPAIITYIASLTPKGERELLRGGDPLQKAQVLSWLVFLSGSVHGQGYGALWRPGRYFDLTTTPATSIPPPTTTPIPNFDPTELKIKQVIQAAGRRSIDKFYGQIEARIGLGGSVYAVGDGLTVVDFYLYLFWRWGVSVGVPMRERYGRWEALVRVLEGRESVRRTLEVEGLELELEF